MSKEKKVTVIMPTHGRLEYLVRAIESVLKQSYANWECLVVSDDPEEFVQKEKLIASYGEPRLRFFRNSKPGGNASRNVGIRQSEGEILFFLDDDDEFTVHKMRRHVESHENADFVYSGCGLAWVRGDNKRVLFVKNANWDGSVTRDEIRDFRWCPSTSSCVSLRKDSLKGEFWDENLYSYQDWDIWFRVVPGLRVSYIADLLTLFHQHGSSRVSRGYNRRKNALLFIQKKYSTVSFGDAIAAQILTEWGSEVRDEIYSRGSFYAPLAVISNFVGLRDFVHLKYFIKAMLSPPLDLWLGKVVYGLKLRRIGAMLEEVPYPHAIEGSRIQS